MDACAILGGTLCQYRRNTARLQTSKRNDDKDHDTASACIRFGSSCFFFSKKLHLFTSGRQEARLVYCLEVYIIAVDVELVPRVGKIKNIQKKHPHFEGLLLLTERKLITASAIPRNFKVNNKKYSTLAKKNCGQHGRSMLLLPRRKSILHWTVCSCELAVVGTSGYDVKSLTS